jgi:ribosomal subunit interface protein
MQIPLQITFRHMDSSPALEDRIRKEATKLDRFYDHIMSCRVVIDEPHAHHHKGKLFHISIDVKAPSRELVVTREHHDAHAHEDVYVAVRDAFDEMQRQLQDYSRRRRGDTKTHEPVPHGRVIVLVPEEDYGRIRASDGREIYFHRNSVLEDGFDSLEIGSEVRYAEEAGELGPQASSVIPLGKHHIIG